MKLAEYKRIEDGTFWGEIPGFQGLWGNAATLDECEVELKEPLESWLSHSLWLNDDGLPVLEEISLVPRPACTGEVLKASRTTRS